MAAPSAVVGILEYGVGNAGSIHNMLKFLGIRSAPVLSPADLSGVDRLILPGVGAFDFGMSQLETTGAGMTVMQAVDSGYPILGICLGMQLLTGGSDEGTLPGLGLIPGRCQRLRPTTPVAKVPHMGWNTVSKMDRNLLIPTQTPDDRYYFVHSYHVVLEEPNDEIGSTSYGGLTFTSMFARGLVFGAQFHPEKSHRFGMALLTAFSELCSAG